MWSSASLPDSHVALLLWLRPELIRAVYCFFDPISFLHIPWYISIRPKSQPSAGLVATVGLHPPSTRPDSAFWATSCPPGTTLSLSTDPLPTFCLTPRALPCLWQSHHTLLTQAHGSVDLVLLFPTSRREVRRPTTSLIPTSRDPDRHEPTRLNANVKFSSCCISPLAPLNRACRTAIVRSEPCLGTPDAPWLLRSSITEVCPSPMWTL